MENNLVVVKANSLIEASYRLSIDEIRILALTVGTMDPYSSKQEFEFTVADVVREFPEVKIENAYKQIQVAVKKLYDRSVRTEDNEKVTDFRWVSSRTYFKKEGRFRIALTNEVMPYLTQLKGQFTRYELRNISGFSSVHSIRIYELITQYKFRGEREVTIDNLKQWLQVEDKYKQFKDFKKRVLNPAIEEINSKSDLLVSVEELKRGRKVSSLAFTVAEKSKIQTVCKPKFPHKNKFGNFVKFDPVNPKYSSHEFANYALACIQEMDKCYENLSEIPTEYLLHYYNKLRVNESFKCKFGRPNTIYEEIQKRGFKVVNSELVKLEKA